MEADRLVRKAQSTSDSTLKWGYNARARAIMRAQPRETTQREHDTLIAKAAQMPPGAPAETLRRKAAELLEANPPAQRRADSPAVAKAMRIAKSARVAKAAAEADMADDLTPIYSADGQLTGVVSAAEIIPLTDEVVAKMAELGVTVVDDKNRPVSLGGTTGLGMPRTSPQQRLPGDVPDRQVVKSGLRTGR